MNTPVDPPRFQSTCPHDCPSTCALEVEKIDSHTIGRVYGADNSYTQGVVCAKVARYAERIHHPERLSQPLKRTNSKSADGKFEPISWDDALDCVAQNMQSVIEKYGAESIWPYHYAGTMGLVQRDGINRFRNCLGTSQQHSTFCTTLADAGWTAGIGSKRGADSRLISEESDLIVVWGGNPVNTQVNLMHHIATARKRDAKLVVIDPYKTGTAKQADLHLMLRPGTDGALAVAVMHVLFKEGFADRDYLRGYTDFSHEFETHLENKTPAWAAEITGLSTDQIVQFARLFGSTKKSFVRIGYGFSRTRNGAVNVHAVTCLPAITGAWRVAGGGALYSNAALYQSIDKTVIEGLDAACDVRVFDQSRIGDVLLGNKKDLQGGTPVKSLFIQNTNPAVVAPESNKVIKGLNRPDLFVCVHEQFLTDTAKFADIVLPATMFLEHDDLYVAGGHTHIQMTKKIVEPFAQSRSNHTVLCQLAERLGIEHPGFNMTEWELCDQALANTGISAAELYNQKWLDVCPEFSEVNFLDGFDTPDKKFHFSPDWSRVGPNHHNMPRMPDHWEITDNASTDYPFRLVAAPARQFLNTTFTETLSSQKREKRPTVMMHPDDVESLPVEDGQKVRMRSQCGDVVVHVKAFEGVQPGVVIMESIWPNSAFSEGVGVNALISAEPGYPNGGGVFHDTAVAIESL